MQGPRPTFPTSPIRGRPVPGHGVGRCPSVAAVSAADELPEPGSEGDRGKDAAVSEDIRLLGRLLGQVVRDQAGDDVFELVEERPAPRRRAPARRPQPARHAARRAHRALDRRPAAPHPGVRLARRPGQHGRGRAPRAPPPLPPPPRVAAPGRQPGGDPGPPGGRRRRRRGDPPADRRPARRARDHRPPDRGPPPDRARRARRRRRAAGRPDRGRRRVGRPARHRSPARAARAHAVADRRAAAVQAARRRRDQRGVAVLHGEPVRGRAGASSATSSTSSASGGAWTSTPPTSCAWARGSAAIATATRSSPPTCCARRRSATPSPRSATTSPRVRRLSIELSMSSRLITPTAELQALADASGDDSPFRADEPYRRALRGMYARTYALAVDVLGPAAADLTVPPPAVPRPPYTTLAELADDLEVVRASLGLARRGGARRRARRAGAARRRHVRQPPLRPRHAAERGGPRAGDRRAPRRRRRVRRLPPSSPSRSGSPC